MPKTTPVASEVRKANSSTGMEGDASMGMPADPGIAGNASWRIRRVPANAIAMPATPPARESNRLSMRGSLTTRDSSRAQGHAQGYLAPPLHAAHEHEIGDVRADDQQHESGNTHQDQQPLLVLLAQGS